MSESLPSEIEVVELPGGAYYRLPRRDLGGLRYVGVFIGLLGLLIIGFAVAWMSLPLAMFWRGGNDPFDWVGVIIALFGIPFVLMGLALLGVGGLLILGRSEVELHEGRVRAIERLGPFRWSWFRPVEQIRQFVVTRGNVKVNHRPVTSGPLADMAAIKIECKEGQPVALAPGYPRAWLLALAHDLASRCNLLEPSAALDAPPPIQVTEERITDPPVAIERLAQPAGSDVTVQEDQTGVTLTVPPAGLRKGSQGLFGFSIVWLVFSLIVGGIVIAATVNGKAKGEDFWGPVIAMPVFVLVGGGMLLGAINMGKRRAVLAVVGDRLLVMQTGIFGSKQHEWARDQLADVSAGPSGMKVNKRPVLELQVHPKEGRHVGLLAGRDQQELRWIANVLALALKLHQAQPAGLEETVS